MTTDVTVRRLREDEVDTATAMLARAFSDDPVARLIDRDPVRQEPSLRWLFTLFVRYGLAYGEVWAEVASDGAIGGAAVWWAPEHAFPSTERFAALGLADGLAVLGPAAMERLAGLGAAAGELHQRAISEPHWYLSIFGVAPERQRRGVGRRILAPMLDRLDREGLPVYLETMKAENVPYYERHGFTMVAESTLDGHDLRIWGLLRQPR